MRNRPLLTPFLDKITVGGADLTDLEVQLPPSRMLAFCPAGTLPGRQTKIPSEALERNSADRSSGDCTCTRRLPNSRKAQRESVCVAQQTKPHS
jgi:hypothetical protein